MVRRCKRKKIPKTLRIAVWDKWFGLKKGQVKCPICLNIKICQLDHDIGHIKAISKGGSYHINNLIPLCRLCNLSIGVMNIKRFMKKWYNRKL